MTMIVVNPATGERIQSYAELTAAEVTSAIADAHHASAAGGRRRSQSARA